MALTADRNLDFFASQEFAEYGIDDDVIIYKGALVGRNRTTGYARALAAGDEFLGVAYRKADNTISGHVAGGVRVKLQQSIDIVHTLTSVVIGDIGKDVYASDDSTLTLPPIASVRAGGWMRIIKTSAAAFAITLDGNGAELVDGAATLATVDAQYDCVLLLCTGSEWIVASRDIA